MAHGNNKNDGSSHGHYLVPLGHYYKVLVALLILTVVTVAISRVNLGHWNTPVAMLIATVKAFLVMLIFMGLKYDTAENNGTIYSAFIFLLIFVTLTWMDMFYRRPEQPVQVEKVAGGAAVDLEKLLKPTPELIAKGKAQYSNCAACHGDAGKGDGPAAAAFNPKPRNFVSEKFKNGDSVIGIVGTLTKGLPPNMPAFPSIPLEERFALAHYVRSLGSRTSESSADEIEKSGLKGGEKSTPKIPVDAAIEVLVREADQKKK